MTHSWHHEDEFLGMSVEKDKILEEELRRRGRPAAPRSRASGGSMRRGRSGTWPRPARRPPWPPRYPFDPWRPPLVVPVFPPGRYWDRPSEPPLLGTDDPAGAGAQPSENTSQAAEYTRWVQFALNRIMDLALPINGIMDASVRQALRRFQQQEGMTATGFVDPLTERKLIKLLAGSNKNITPRNEIDHLFEVAASTTGATIGTTALPDWITWVPSPYHSSRAGEPILAIIYHYTAGPSLDGTVRWFQNNPNKVSAHFVIGKDGRIVQMVPLARSAHHAGASRLAGCRRGVNRCSIGIEIVNWGVLSKRGKQFYTYSGRRYRGPTPVFARGLWWEPYPAVQLKAIIRLTRYLLSHYPGITHITGHEDIAPGRKSDPGGAFGWAAVQSALADMYTGHLGPLPAAPRREINDIDELSWGAEEEGAFPDFTFEDSAVLTEF